MCECVQRAKERRGRDVLVPVLAYRQGLRLLSRIDLNHWETLIYTTSTTIHGVWLVELVIRP